MLTNTTAESSAMRAPHCRRETGIAQSHSSGIVRETPQELRFYS